MIRRQKIEGSHQVKVTFVLPADYPHVPISVVGDFNQWDPTAHPLQRRSDGTYEAMVILETGRRYAFRYLSSDGQWFSDGFADAFELNAFGTDNSIVVA
jgi:1,4-alpha-glucan branching enzyme